jgi:hypothetical protein
VNTEILDERILERLDELKRTVQIHSQVIERQFPPNTVVDESLNSIEMSVILLNSCIKERLGC